MNSHHAFAPMAMMELQLTCSDVDLIMIWQVTLPAWLRHMHTLDAQAALHIDIFRPVQRTQIRDAQTCEKRQKSNANQHYACCCSVESCTTALTLANK